MKYEKVNAARILALKFTEKAKALELATPDKNWIQGSALSGSLRRLSMELTRALAEMRKP